MIESQQQQLADNPRRACLYETAKLTTSNLILVQVVLERVEDDRQAGKFHESFE
jgi:hypothetical protein